MQPEPWLETKAGTDAAWKWTFASSEDDAEQVELSVTVNHRCAARVLLYFFLKERFVGGQILFLKHKWP